MDNTDILEQIANNPDLLAELTRDERFADTINAAANESVIKSRDKALREKNNWKERAEALTETKDVPPSEPAVAPVASTPTTNTNSTANVELLRRIKDMEDQLAKEKLGNLAIQKKDALKGALGNLPLREGGMNVASKLIDVDNFDVQSDGTIRHINTGMQLSEYVKDEWSKTPEAQLVIDTSANRGAGSSQGRRGLTSSVGKKFSESSVEEKNNYYLEHGQSDYASWRDRG